MSEADGAESSLHPQTSDAAPGEKAAASVAAAGDSECAAEGAARGSHTVSGSAPHGKKRHRRRPSKKKRRWKPYYKLSWEEKKALEERETARASRVRAEMFAKGLPVAPYNTTQFLMEEHDREEPDLNTGLGWASEEDYPELEEEEEEEEEGAGEFLERDFSETYEKYHAESVQDMSKQELVREYLELEKCMSRLEEENNRLRRQLEDELRGLRAQNSELRRQAQLCQEGRCEHRETNTA